MTRAGRYGRAGRLGVTAAALVVAAGCGTSSAHPEEHVEPAAHVGGAVVDARALPDPVVLDPPAEDRSSTTAAPPSPGPDPSPPPGAPGAATPSASVPTSEPAPALDDLRATERFLELATHERAVDATWARFAWATFAPQAGGEVLFEWTNKAALWDELVPDFRDECLLAGPEASRTMWDAKVLIAAGGGLAWNDATTGGRGDFVEFSCLYDVAGEPVERFFGALITTDEDQAGHVRLRMPPFDVREDDYSDFETSRAGVDADLWAWVEEQPPAALD